MIKEKRNTLILVSSFLPVCLIVTSIFAISIRRQHLCY